jgi:hypothetical protein
MIQFNLIMALRLILRENVTRSGFQARLFKVSAHVGNMPTVNMWNAVDLEPGSDRPKHGRRLFAKYILLEAKRVVPG